MLKIAIILGSTRPGRNGEAVAKWVYEIAQKRNEAKELSSISPRYRLFQRSSGIFFVEDRISKKQESLKTRDKIAAQRIFSARNEAHQQPAINLQIARAYLMASDPAIATRTWQHVMGDIVKTKLGETKARWLMAIKDECLGTIRNVTVISTTADQFFRVIEANGFNKCLPQARPQLRLGHELASIASHSEKA